jgi:histidyl-tRNA synthetase
MSVKKPRGTNDFFGTDVELMKHIEDVVREVCDSFCIKEIRTPMFEYTELFARGVGETTDIVQKEMFTFEDRGGRSLTLKPEGTAGAARAFVENSLYGNAQPTKVYYITSCFRNERPQAGRYKEFHQFGVEMYGTYSAYADAELISLVYEILNRLGIKNIRLKLNSLGGNECRLKYNSVLKDYIGANINEMCSDCRERFDKNPLRVLDCKNENCKKIIGDAPAITDVLGDECKAHFETLKASLTAMGIPFEVDPKIVRGLDYYTKTVFEFVSDDIGSQGTICGGGRYDNLVKECGGPNVGAVGFAMGIERIMMVLKNQGIAEDTEKTPLIYIGSIGESGTVKAQEIGYELRKAGISAEYDVVGRSVKAQMKYADKIGAKYNIVIGDDEIANDSVKLKNMLDGEQREIKLSDIVNELKNM